MDRDIQTAIQKLAGTFKRDSVTMLAGTVKSVDEDKATCVVVVENDVEVPDVRLQSVICDGLLILPVVESDVMILFSKQNEPFICLYSDIKKWYMQVGDSSDTITDDGKRIFNDGKFGGLIKVKDPDDSNIGLLKKINNLENLVNNILTTLKSTTIPLAPSGTYPFAPLYTSLSNIAPITSESDITSNLITHGKI